VLEGLRGPRDERNAKASPRAAGRDQIPQGKRVYQSLAAKYRLQLTSEDDVILPNGRKVAGRPMTAVFEDQFLVLDTSRDKKMIDLLDTSDYNRQNGGDQFWDFQIILDGIVEARRKQAIEILSNPDDRTAIIEALRAEGVDFDLPKTTAAKREPAAPTAEAPSKKTLS
jgi:hypothetical protein